MSIEFTLSAEVRDDQGKGASRRLRRESFVPAVLYGGGEDPQPITLKLNELTRKLQEEAFYTQPITVDVSGNSVTAILRDVQRHPAKEVPMHIDLQRLKDGEAIRVTVPVHYLNANQSEGVKLQGGTFSRVAINVEISCLPKDIPAFVEVDVVSMKKGDILHLSDIKLPEGVELPALALGEDHNQAIAAIN